MSVPALIDDSLQEEVSTHSQDVRTSVSARARPRVIVPTIGVLLIAVCALAIWAFSMRSPSQGPAADAAMTYAQQYMEWSRGPTVQSVRTVPLRRLGEAATAEDRRAMQDVNVSDLLHRYGASRKVTVVDLHGTFNSLPPDEGIVMAGDVIVLVDHKTNHVILLMQ